MSVSMTVRRLLHERLFVLSVLLGLLTLGFGVASYANSIREQPFAPLTAFRVDFGADTVTAGQAIDADISFCSEKAGLPIFIATFWTSPTGEQRLGPGTIANTADNCGTIHIQLGTSLSHPTGPWRLVVHAFVVGGSDTQVVIVGSTTPKGRASGLLRDNYLTVSGGG